jgi:hypothetical protein
MRDAISAHEAAPGAGPLLLDGCEIADLGLTMTVPGWDGLELCANGADVDVTADNLRQYVEGVADQV